MLRRPRAKALGAVRSRTEAAVEAGATRSRKFWEDASAAAGSFTDEERAAVRSANECYFNIYGQ